LGRDFALWAAFAAMSGAVAQADGQLQLSGTVVNSVTGAPVRYAQVALSPSGRETQTDAAGAFQFTDLAPGEYMLAAGKAGFVSQDEEAVGLAVTLTESREKVAIRLVPLASIRGKVADDSGDAVEGATVIAMASGVRQGRRGTQLIQAVQTNDRGEYRIGSLRPGKYLIRADNPTARGGYYGKGDTTLPSPDSFAPVFFGGSRDATQATPLDLQAGTETRADVQVVLRPAHTIRGRMAGYRPHTNAVLQLSAGESDLGLNISSIEFNTGRFEIRGVLDGAYRLRAFQPGEGGEMRIAERDIEVSGKDVEDFAVTLVAPLALRGTVVVQGSAESKADFAVQLQTRDAFIALNDQLGSPRSGEATDGGFEIASVFPGKYWVDFITGEGQYVASARVGQNDLLSTQELIVPLGSAAPAIEVVLRTDGGTVTGTVGAVLATDEVALLLVPEACNRPAEIAGLEQGAFRIPDVAPGRYRLYAWKSPSEVEYGAPAALCALARGGVPVEVSAGKETRIQVEKLMEEPK
jgi:protocatechuate 3,4-dioxygenase beta subunit